MPTSGKQEQEWTAEYVSNLILKCQLTDQPPFAVVIADAHNASLTAEREKLGAIVGNRNLTIQQLREQLAAAQATAQAHNDINGDICHIDIADTTALDAERKLREQTERNYHNLLIVDAEQAKEIQQLREQLADCKESEEQAYGAYKDLQKQLAAALKKIDELTTALDAAKLEAWEKGKRGEDL
jgi:hypothetical protein